MKTPNQIQGWQGNHKIFGELCEQVKPKIIIEIGSWKGQSTVNLAMNAPEAKIYAVDTWLGASEFYTMGGADRDLKKVNGYPTIFYEFQENVKGYNVEPLPIDSVSGARILKHWNIKADLIYIDASHEQGDVERDIRAYLPLLNQGGIMFGDDYGNRDFKGLKHDVDLVFGDKVKIIDNWFWVFDNK